MDVDVIRELVAIMNQNGLLELEIREKDLIVRLSKTGSRPSPSAEPAAADPAARENPAPAPLPGPERAADAEITSPMVGTFYRSASPDGNPFVGVGDAVEPETVIGIIEAMKIMNEIQAGKRGRIKEFLVVDHETVEYGQPLAVVEPAMP